MQYAIIPPACYSSINSYNVLSTANELVKNSGLISHSGKPFQLEHCTNNGRCCIRSWASMEKLQEESNTTMFPGNSSKKVWEMQFLQLFVVTVVICYKEQLFLSIITECEVVSEGSRRCLPSTGRALWMSIFALCIKALIYITVSINRIKPTFDSGLKHVSYHCVVKMHESNLFTANYDLHLSQNCCRTTTSLLGCWRNKKQRTFQENQTVSSTCQHKSEIVAYS